MPRSKKAAVPKTPRWRLAAGWAAAWVANAALWLLLGGNLSLEELAASLAAATLACAGGAVFHSADRSPCRPTARMLLEAWRIPGDLLDGAWKVLGGLAGCLVGNGLPPGVLRAAKLDMGQEGDPKSNARRAITITYTTLTPNTVVLGFVPSQGLMLYHQFKPTDELKMAKSLEASP